MAGANLHQLPLAYIVQRCVEETDRFHQRKRHNTQYCFELFRRAIVKSNQRAWEYVYAQYRPQVAKWIEIHPSYPTSGEEIQYFINRTFERFWIAVKPDKFDNFPNLASILGYLKMCVNSAVHERARGAQRAAWEDSAGIPHDEGDARDTTVEDEALEQLQLQELWTQIEAGLCNEQERIMAHGTLILGLKPSEILAEFTQAFRDVKELYRVKENVFARLRRNDDLRKLLSGDA